MNKQLKNYVRPFRRRSGVTQRQFAFLIGGASISCIELFKQIPNLLASHTCFLFGVQAADRFPHSLSEVKRDLKYRANELYEQLARQPLKKHEISWTSSKAY
jgi:hypothetical protein